MDLPEITYKGRAPKGDVDSITIRSPYIPREGDTVTIAMPIEGKAEALHGRVAGVHWDLLPGKTAITVRLD